MITPGVCTYVVAGGTATTVWRYCQIGSTYGTPAWADPGNITISDDAYSTASSAGTSGTLRANSFGFTSSDIPTGATILGIQVGIERFRDSGTVTDNVIQLAIDNNGNAGDRIGTNQSTGTSWLTTESEVLYGGPSNLFGASPTRAQVISSSFAFDLVVSVGTAGRPASVDAIRMRVTYST